MSPTSNSLTPEQLTMLDRLRANLDAAIQLASELIGLQPTPAEVFIATAAEFDAMVARVREGLHKPAPQPAAVLPTEEDPAPSQEDPAPTGAWGCPYPTCHAWIAGDYGPEDIAEHLEEHADRGDQLPAGVTLTVDMAGTIGTAEVEPDPALALLATVPEGAVSDGRGGWCSSRASLPSLPEDITPDDTPWCDGEDSQERWSCTRHPHDVRTTPHAAGANGRTVAVWWEPGHEPASYMTLDGPDPDARRDAEQADKRFRVTLVCCGHDDGTYSYATWEEANALRESYMSGPGVDPHGYSGDGWSGHQRAGIITVEEPASGDTEPATAALGEQMRGYPEADPPTTAETWPTCTVDIGAHVPMHCGAALPCERHSIRDDHTPTVNERVRVPRGGTTSAAVITSADEPDFIEVRFPDGGAEDWVRTEDVVTYRQPSPVDAPTSPEARRAYCDASDDSGNLRCCLAPGHDGPHETWGF